ncbi:uncharacterized protein LOC144634989 isoform X2 [Oculina patagonica]
MVGLKLIYQVNVFLVLFMAAHAVSVPDPIALYPLNSKYDTQEINNRQPKGTPVGVSLAAGPDGKAGGSYQFAGHANSYIEFPNDGGLDTQRSITMLCWIYPQNTDGPIFNYKTSGAWGVHMWMVWGKLFARFTHRNYWFTPHLITTQPLALNQWHYVGSSYDHNTGIASLWLNGQQVVQQNIGAGMNLATQDAVRMGVKAGDGRFFQGRITAMQVYDVALTAEQINAVENAGQADICEDEKPCKNGGACSIAGDSYTCTCAEGFQGPTCENDVNECATLKPCQNGGQCKNTHGSYECTCKPGYTGKDCETEWEKQGCWKEVKSKKKKAMGKIYGKFKKNKKDVQAAVEACLKSAEEKQLQVFGVRNKYKCATTKGSADFRVHGASNGCKEQGDYGVGVKKANYVYILKKEQ